MRKLSILVLLLTAFAANMIAGDNYTTNDYHVTIEGGVGMPFGLSNVAPFTKNKVGIAGYGEIRYQFNKLPIDVGFYVSGNVLNREMTDYVNHDFTSTNYMLTLDYNHRVASHFTVFGGVGLGMASIDTSAKVEYMGSEFAGSQFSDNGTSGSFAFMPRVGVTAFNVLRFTAGYKFQERANRHAFISLGVTLGLGKIKK